MRYSGGASGITLTATLTQPRRGGPFPCVILISGSGPQDRDGSIFGHRPFCVIADHLTRQGLAVLRVDDRGVGGSTGSSTDATSEDFAADVRAGIRFLSDRHTIDPSRIGLVGYDEGGLIAPLVAARSKDVAFIVLLGGSGIPGEALLMAQGDRIRRAMGESDQATTQQRSLQRHIFAAARSASDDSGVEKQVRDAFRETLGAGDSATREAQVESALAMTRSRWLRHFLDYDPRPALRKVKCPVLAMNGDKDLQVSADQNLPEIEKALRKGGNRKAQVVTCPGLNHMFQTCRTGLPTEYAANEETFSPVALGTMTAWILRHVAPRRDDVTSDSR